MNLLTEPLFRVETTGDSRSLSFPALLSALGADEVESLPGLQRHQEDAFHIFLCQLAASVLVREKKTDPIKDEAFWRDGIRRLTGRDDDCAWTLVVEDVGNPAFMQPPTDQIPSMEKLTPDSLDTLQLAKNHDVKNARSTSPNNDEWIFSLINLQTNAGYSKGGKDGFYFQTIKANGAYGSRCCVELQIQALSIPTRFKRNVTRLLLLRNELLRRPWPYKENGDILLWILPWDGSNSLALGRLDPFYIEAGRIVRMTFDHERITAFTRPTKVARIAAKEQKGVLGDPWIPINTGGKELTALTVSANGFTPDLLHRIIFEEDTKPAFMQRPAPDEVGQPMTFYASVLVRGKRGTEGFHSARIPIPTQAGFALFGGRDEKQRLQETSKRWLADARTMHNKVLKFALFTLLEAGPEKVNFDKPEVSAWVDRIARDFAQAWSHDYFDWLWRSLDHESEDAAHLPWLESLEKKARRVLDDAMERLPARHGRRLRARVEAKGRYYGALNKHFPELKEARDGRRTA